MSSFFTIKHIQDYDKATYYSVCLEDEDDSLFEQFLNYHKEVPEAQEELVEIVQWITKIGKEIGADLRYFRHEGTISDTKALPPPAKYIEGNTGQLRLYCLVANKHVVFLFNGGRKTTQKAQDCPNIAGLFRQANKLSKAINQAFSEKEITWNEFYDDIVFNQELEIYLP